LTLVGDFVVGADASCDSELWGGSARVKGAARLKDCSCRGTMQCNRAACGERLSIVQGSRTSDERKLVHRCTLARARERECE
jgi:hypothetical protein